MYGSFTKESHYQLAKITYYSVEVMDPDLQLPSLGGGIQSFSIRLKVRWVKFPRLGRCFPPRGGLIIFCSFTFCALSPLGGAFLTVGTQSNAVTQYLELYTKICIYSKSFFLRRSNCNLESKYLHFTLNKCLLLLWQLHIEGSSIGIWKCIFIKQCCQRN